MLHHDRGESRRSTDDTVARYSLQKVVIDEGAPVVSVKNFKTNVMVNIWRSNVLGGPDSDLRCPVAQAFKHARSLVL